MLYTMLFNKLSEYTPSYILLQLAIRPFMSLTVTKYVLCIHL